MVKIYRVYLVKHYTINISAERVSEAYKYAEKYFENENNDLKKFYEPIKAIDAIHIDINDCEYRDGYMEYDPKTDTMCYINPY